MYKVLKNIALAIVLSLFSVFIVSCDKEDQSFDYKYDGLTSLPAPEIDLEQARRIQRSGKVEDVQLGKAKLNDIAVDADDMPESEDDDFYIEPTSPTDPNFM